tara:strand:+ start:236 stop:1837 length:1602 start_codon:yes stop_codon:yes gene_type:complete
MVRFDPLYNVSAFDGTINSDFMRLGTIPETHKKDLISYSAKGFDDYKKDLLQYVQAVYPEDYNNFVESDLGVMFLELIAYVASQLSFKADFIANESFISTVSKPNNLKKLMKLIGVNMKGPVGARTTVELDLTTTHVDATKVFIPKTSRTFRVTSPSEGIPLVYTLYHQDAVGNIVYDSSGIEDILVDAYQGTVSGLLALEGNLHTREGSFLTSEKAPTILIEKGSVVEGSIAVSSTGGVVWSEIEHLYLASSNTAAVFEKEYNEDYSCTLRFGDGARSKKPPVGGNYKVFYRTGGGKGGNIPRNSIRSTIAVEKNSAGGTAFNAGCVNTTKGTGGTDAETISHAKKYGPMFFQTQYRAVTGKDYTTVANSFVGTGGVVGKAIAVNRRNGPGGNLIDVYLFAKASNNQLERASLSFKNELLTHMNQYKMMTDELTMADGVLRTLDLITTVVVSKAYKNMEEEIKLKISEKIIEHFSMEAIEFGTPFLTGSLIKEVIVVPGVNAFKVDNYPENVYVNFNELLQLNNFEINVEYI